MAFTGRFPRTRLLKLIAEGYGWEDACEILDIRAPENIARVRQFVGSRRRKKDDTPTKPPHDVKVSRQPDVFSEAS